MPDTRLEWTNQDGTPKLVERVQTPVPVNNEPPSVDMIIQQQDKQTIQRLQQQFNQASGVIKQQVDDEKQAILNQYLIRNADMKRKYDAETDPQRKQSILDQTLSIKSQVTGKIQELNDKFLPANRELETVMNTEMQKVQQASAQRDFRLQTIRQLVQAGNMDPIQAKKAEYKMMGIDWEPPARQSPTTQLSELRAKITDIDKVLKRYTPSKERTLLKNKGQWWGKDTATYLDPITGETRKLDPDKPEDQNIITQMDTLAKEGMVARAQHQALLLASPEFRTYAEKKAIWDDAQTVVTGKDTGKVPLKESIVIAKGKPEAPQSVGQDVIRQRNKKTGQIRISYDGGKTWQIE